MDPKINEGVSSARRTAGKGSIYTFAEIYMSDHLKYKPSQVHKYIYAKLQKASNVRGTKLAIAAPRNFGKSTLITLIYILYSICYDKEKFIVVISNTAYQSMRMLDNIKSEILNNEKLRKDFPHVFGDSKIKLTRWQQNCIITCNGVQVLVLGSGQQIRGLRYGINRPTLIIADDLENTKSVHSSNMREKLKEWFYNSVLKAGAEDTNVIFIGNLFHPYSLLSECIENATWTNEVYSAIETWPTRMDLWNKFENILRGRDKSEGAVGREAARKFYAGNAQAMDAGAKLLWPERDNLCDLMEKYYENEFGFMAEMQNKPRNPKDCPFNVDEFSYWSDKYKSARELLLASGDGVDFFGACDPSMGKSDDSDNSAIIVLARDKDGVLYIVEADIKRRQPNEIIDDIITYHRAYNFQLFAVESNNFQELMIKQLEDKARAMKQYIPIERINNRSNKEARIKSLQSLFHRGTVCFNRNDLDLINECVYFPKGKSDDGLDALEMAIHIAQEPGEVKVLICGRDRDDDNWLSDYQKNLGWPKL